MIFVFLTGGGVSEECYSMTCENSLKFRVFLKHSHTIHLHPVSGGCHTTKAELRVTETTCGGTLITLRCGSAGSAGRLPDHNDTVVNSMVPWGPHVELRHFIVLLSLDPQHIKTRKEKLDLDCCACKTQRGGDACVTESDGKVPCLHASTPHRGWETTPCMPTSTPRGGHSTPNSQARSRQKHLNIFTGSSPKRRTSSQK